MFTTGVGPEPNTPTVGTSIHPAVRRGLLDRLGVAFTPILWNLSGPLTLFGVTLPKAMFWIVLAYVFVATVIAFWIGRPIIWLSLRQRDDQRRVPLRAGALARRRRGGRLLPRRAAERGTLADRLRRDHRQLQEFVRRGVGFLGWNLARRQIIDPLPLVVQAPRLFAGADHPRRRHASRRARSASVQSSLSFFRAVYDSFAGYRAAIIRLDGWCIANEAGQGAPARDGAGQHDGSVELDAVEVRTPGGERLIDPLDVRLTPATPWSSPAQSGTRQDHAAAQPRPAVAVRLGHGALPDRGARHDVPLPAAVRAAGRSARRGVLPGRGRRARRRRASRRRWTPCRSGISTSRLDETSDWAKVLSPGEQQRIAFARVLLAKPRAVFLDESTSALDEGQEFALYRALRRRAAGQRRWSASATAAPWSSITTGTWNCSAVVNGGSDGRRGAGPGVAVVH